MALAPHLNAYRDDLADIALKDKVKADRYASGTTYFVQTATAPMQQKPGTGSRWGSELIHGERVSVFEIADGFAWCQNMADRYVGYVPASCLTPEKAGEQQPGHKVTAIRAPLFPEGDLKTPIIGYRSFGSTLDLTGAEKNRFVETTTGAWIYSRHVAPVDTRVADYVETARRFLELPYIWGGRSCDGLDCSALVQLALNLAGIADCPRDTPDQKAGLGAALPPDTARKRGDLALFPGHIGIMLDETLMIHANATHMAVTINPADDVAQWTLKSDGAGITGINRLD